jgi:hypothetical protein
MRDGTITTYTDNFFSPSWRRHQPKAASCRTCEKGAIHRLAARVATATNLLPALADVTEPQMTGATRNRLIRCSSGAYDITRLCLGATS